MPEYKGITECHETLKGFLSNKPNIGKLSDGRPVANFTVVFGINDPKTNKFATWRNGRAYGELAYILEECYSKTRYISLSGFITSNGVSQGCILQKDAFNHPLTKELIIVQSGVILERHISDGKQLSLVD